MLALNYGPAVDPLAALEAEGPRRDLRLRAQPRLSRGGQRQAEDARRLARRRGPSRAGRRQGVRRHRAGDGEAARRGGGPRLARQAHQSRQPRIRLMAVPRRDLHRPRPAVGRGRTRSLRPMPRLPRRLSDGGLSCALQARRAPMHFLPDHRAQGDDRARAAAADRQPHLRLRRLPGGLSVEQVRPHRRRSEARRARRPRGAAAGRTRRARRRALSRTLRRRPDQANRSRPLSAQCDDRDRQLRRSVADRGGAERDRGGFAAGQGDGGVGVRPTRRSGGSQSHRVCSSRPRSATLRCWKSGKSLSPSRRSAEPRGTDGR